MTATGPATLAELFGTATQLVIYHLMFGPGWDQPCPGCASWADAFNGTTHQFAAQNAHLVAMSRAPAAELLPVAERKGWTFDWVSSFGSDFNEDYYVSAPLDVSKRTIDGTGEVVGFDRGENHGVSVFAKNGAGEVFHTYSVYNRGIEDLNGVLGYLDLLPEGRGRM